ncbi:unnamed protein product [Lactuca saligna]|uniref:Uncharacterized protein n=1 Tax=Lactuca saligna TaxID=75948 RepID=A0AA36DZZ4_LACSI|nr:unnamed protein product [Lactuca saligna]
MSPFPLKGHPTRPHKNMYRLLQRYTNEASTPASTPTMRLTTSTSPLFGTQSAPITTHSSTPTPSFSPTSTTTASTTPIMFNTLSAPSSASTPLFSTLSSPSSTSAPLFSTLSTPSSTSATSSSPSSTQAPSSAPSSTAATSTPIATEQEDAQLEQRMNITVRANTLLPSGKCSSIITKSFLDKVDENGYKWVNLSEETKIFYWEEFQKKCQWDVAVSDSVVKAAWEQKAKERYQQYIYDISTRNPTREKPCHIEIQVWNAWNAIWNSEDFKKKSEQNKKNRRKGVVGGKAPPTHNGGSASHQQIAADMEEYTGKAPSCYELFMFTHTKDHDGKTFQVDKAKEVHDLFVSRRADLALLGEEVPESELFYAAVGGHDRKKRVYGLGSYGRSIFRENFSQTCTSPDTSFEKDHLERKIQKLEETINQQRMELDDVRNMVNDMNNQ